MEEKYLYLPEAQNEKYWDLDTDNWLESLGDIKSVNIFVGANNSGKSRLMRMLISKNHFIIQPAKTTIIELQGIIAKPSYNRFKNTFIDILNLVTLNPTQNKILIERYIYEVRLQLLSENIRIQDKLDNIKKIFTHNINQAIYIPILRSLLTFFNHPQGISPNNPNTSDMYQYTILELYKSIFIQNEKNNHGRHINIFTGRTLYDDIKRSLLKNKTTQDNFRAFETFISEIFFNGKSISITPEIDTNHIMIHFDETGEERNIHEYGDGLQTILMLTYKLFMAEKGTWIFIEEPELNLHPAYQRIFLELITQNEYIKSKKLTIFFTTHSNHLLDITITQNSDVSIFVFERGERNGENVSLVRNVSATDLQTLDTLGVHNSSVFMANCSIWVEGITDRIYIRNYLKAYIKHCQDNPNIEFEKEYKEDLHFAFFEYAGTNLKHYTFDDSEDENIKVPNRVFVIADQDLGKEGKHNAFKEQLGEKYQVLNVLEIENLLKGDFIKNILPKWNLQGVSYSDDTFKDVYFIEEGYKDIFLKTYLIQLFKENGIDIPKVWEKEPNTTFSSDHKQKLPNLTNDITWDEMSKEAQELTKKIYNFIKANNQTKA